MESGVLLVMAFDRFVAICDPLRYTTVLTNARIAQIGSCGLSHSYHYHVDLIQLSYPDNRIHSILGLFALFSTTGFDCPCILLSYVQIIRSVLNIASSEERQKSFITCIAHISAVAIFTSLSSTCLLFIAMAIQHLHLSTPSWSMSSCSSLLCSILSSTV
uniref:Uncharacterized protein n=1 Tax=Molossus molossus TaxID=27622 RepID=A0A7J8ER62_MOLMO|nr:hypothetical protein HJG59_008704 [Molossus molossus]